MADESQYDVTNKRKYEESPPPRRMTGFSSQPDPPSYNTVPPPMSEIEIAKQKAQAIAAKLLNNSDPTKRPRVETNGGSLGASGYESTDSGFSAPKALYGMSAPQQVSSYGGGGGGGYGMGGPSKKIDIPNGRVGVIIGKGGETIKYLQMQSGAKIQVTRDMDSDPNSATRAVELTGTPDQIAVAEKLITDVLAEAETGGSGVVSRRVSGQPSGGEPFVMMIPNNKVGLVIGKGGETIKSMQAKTGARIQVIPLHLPPGDMSKERTVQIDGTSEQIEAAKQLVNEVTSENRMRNPSMSGGYPQQGYQSQPPSNWAQPGPPMQQSGYGYGQPGAYPAPPQYNQPPYPGYPPQPTSGGYTSAGWDQSSAPQNQQAGGYDYYNQQPSTQQPQPDAASNYGYGQPPAAYSQGQGYGQDGYGNYQAAGGNTQSGYPETQSNTGYDQSQQGGYSSAAYGTTTNPTPDSSYSTPQGENTSQAPPASGQSYTAPTGDAAANPSYAPPSTQPSYGAPPPTSQAGYGYGSYGPPQTQKPPAGQPAYAQPQQSPSAAGQGGAGAYGGYPPPTQTAPPSSGYPATQPGYGAPPAAYGAYGQQPAPYPGSYGSGGYPAPAPAPYASGDGSNGGSARGNYDATPPQSAPTTGAAKASPTS